LGVEWTLVTTGPRLVALEAVATNPRNIVVPSLDVTFAAPIDPASFDYQDLTLVRDGGSNLISPDVRVERLGDTRYRIREFHWVVGQEGAYTLTVHAANILDPAGNPGSGALATSWVMDTTAPAAPQQLAIAPDSGISATDAAHSSRGRPAPKPPRSRATASCTSSPPTPPNPRPRRRQPLTLPPPRIVQGALGTLSHRPAGGSCGCRGRGRRCSTSPPQLHHQCPFAGQGSVKVQRVESVIVTGQVQ
jgi:hypothetical protein